MPYVPVNVILDHSLNVNNSISIPYPEGRNEGHFFSGVNHTMSVDGFFYRCPRDFIISMKPDRMVLTWHGEFPLPVRSILNLQLEIPGSDFYFDPKTGVTVENMVHSPMFMINLGTPHAPVEDYYFQRQAITAPQALKLAYDRPDFPRNVVISSTDTNSHCTFLIEGTDLYGRTLRESITGIGVGNKAFMRIRKITTSHPCNGDVWIGMGDRLGLPVFLPAPGYLLHEIVNGQTMEGGMIISGDTNAPSPLTGDCRGTYTPPAEIALDGKHVIHLLLSLPNPGNIGLADLIR